MFKLMVFVLRFCRSPAADRAVNLIRAAQSGPAKLWPPTILLHNWQIKSVTVTLLTIKIQMQANAEAVGV